MYPVKKRIAIYFCHIQKMKNDIDYLIAVCVVKVAHGEISLG